MEELKQIIENAISQAKEIEGREAQMVLVELCIIRACLSDPVGHLQLWEILHGFAEKNIKRLGSEIANAKAIQN